eukprot:Gb_05167 [translate_table: standard]
MKDTKPTTISQDEWDKMNDKAIALIGLNLADLVLMNAIGVKSANELWVNLGKLYESKSLMNLIFLRKKLYALKMVDGGSVTKHLNAFNPLVNQLKSTGDTIKEEEECICLLCSLLDSWENLIVAIGGSTKVEISRRMILLVNYSKKKPEEGHFSLLRTQKPCLQRGEDKVKKKEVIDSMTKDIDQIQEGDSQVEEGSKKSFAKNASKRGTRRVSAKLILQMKGKNL